MKRLIALLLVAATMAGLLAGCGAGQKEVMAPVESQAAVEETQPLTVPADGNLNDVTCKGTYSGEPDGNTVVAEAGSGRLTNGQLQAWYWAAVASYRDSDAQQKPDFAYPLEAQPCGIDDSVNSWQQYFLKQALNNWHTAQALYDMGEEVGLPVEEEHQHMEGYHDENLVDIPAVKYLYREETSFVPNTMHQAWLDNIPAMLDQIAQEQGMEDGNALAEQAFGTTKQDLADMVDLYNRGYMYDTNMSYYITVSEEEVADWYADHEEAYAQQGITKDSGKYVDFRQILLVPEESEDHPGLTVQIAADGSVTCDEDLWAACEEAAADLVTMWKKHKRGRTEGAFADFASKYSMDPSTNIDGGAYRQVKQGQMIEPIDSWIFADGRKNRDYTTIRTQYGIHILCYSSDTEIWYAHSKADLTAQKQRDFVLEARDGYDMTVTYSAITLTQTGSGVSLDRLLYEDLAHERFPEVPLYLQQDYGRTKYGEFLLRTNGCGITTLAMIASYMMDDELTPPEMCRRFGQYSLPGGTDVSLFLYEPANMGFYNRTVYKDEEAYQALVDGYPVVSLHDVGHWTRAGHYLVLEKLNEDGTIQVRDSNLFNYGRLEDHKKDAHEWETIPPSCKVYWVFDKKVTRIGACSRCGDGQTWMLREDYLCHKCQPALLRRDTYLSLNQ